MGVFAADHLRDRGAGGDMFVTLTKLYLVIYQAGLIGGVAGPLPYGIEECGRRAFEMNILAMEKRVGLLFECEWHSERPVIHPSFGKPVDLPP